MFADADTLTDWQSVSGGRASAPISRSARSASHGNAALSLHGRRRMVVRVVEQAWSIEGLAIGVSASTGEIGLATVLIVGFALHNATEGFGIIGSLGDIKPSWRWPALAGLVGGGPTFLGALVGYNFTSEPLELVFYAVAGGAILYVIGEIWHGIRRYGHRELGLILLACSLPPYSPTSSSPYGGG